MENQCFSDNVFTQIKEDILLGVRKPGSKLNIAKLKAQYGVGASPVREALQQLTALGFVESLHLKGFSVATFTKERIIDLLQCRSLLETDAIVKAIKLGDDEWESQVVAAYYRLDKFQSTPGFDVVADHLYYLKHVRSFQLAIFKGCQSPVQVEIIQLLHEQSDPYCFILLQYYLSDETYFPKKQKILKDLFDAVIARDENKIRHVFGNAISTSIKDIQTVLVEQTEKA